MESKNLLMGCMLMLLILLNFAACDVEKDREKCANSLVGLATCLPYVSGEAKAPPSDCCTGFKQVLKTSIDCVCLLIKDRNDPSLGLKINATLALSLPERCKTPLNESITDCPTILHLPPNSPDAKVFEDFAKSANKSNTATPAAAADKGSSSSTSSTADQKSDGGAKKIWLKAHMVAGIFISMFNALSLSVSMASSPKAHTAIALLSLIFLSSAYVSLSAADVHDILPHFNLPKGIIPREIKSFSLSNTDSSFTIELSSNPCYVKFDDQLVYYDKIIKGKLEYGKVSGVSGIQAKKFFIWVSVTGMEVNEKNDMIEFHVGALSKELPASDFQDIPSCKSKGLSHMFSSLELDASI